jgi:hypothetical protein
VAGGAAGVPCDGGEEERRDDAPAGGGARRERGEVEEVEEGEARDAGADEERHEHAEREVVEALQAHDLRHDQPGVPHHRPIEHLRLLPLAAAAPQPRTRSEEVGGEREGAAVAGRGICSARQLWGPVVPDREGDEMLLLLYAGRNYALFPFPFLGVSNSLDGGSRFKVVRCQTTNGSSAA